MINPLISSQILLVLSSGLVSLLLLYLAQGWTKLGKEFHLEKVKIWGS
jgi:hypothetical protein